MTMDQFLDFLESVPERPDPTNPGKTLPAHGAALCMSVEDWNIMKTELEEACRQMGSHCSFAIQETLRKLDH